jgi:hypothetical protein
MTRLGIAAAGRSMDGAGRSDDRSAADDDKDIERLILRMRRNYAVEIPGITIDQTKRLLIHGYGLVAPESAGPAEAALNEVLDELVELVDPCWTGDQTVIENLNLLMSTIEDPNHWAGRRGRLADLDDLVDDLRKVRRELRNGTLGLASYAAALRQHLAAEAYLQNIMQRAEVVLESQDS